MNFRMQLKRQLGFLGRSCALFDEGHEEESIRIAVIIRVLIHQTPRSTSLLTHLDANQIYLLSTTSQITEKIGEVGLTFIQLPPKVLGEVPHLNMAADKHIIPSQQWWNENVISLGKPGVLSRRDIVLCAANKDGGAHVDSNLDPKYNKVLEPGSQGSFIRHKNGKTIRIPIENTIFASVRQMGFELLNSQDLIKLI